MFFLGDKFFICMCLFIFGLCFMDYRLEVCLGSGVFRVNCKVFIMVVIFIGVLSIGNVFLLL